MGRGGSALLQRYCSRPPEEREHVTLRLAVTMRLRAAKRRKTRVFLAKNIASQCPKLRIIAKNTSDFQVGLNSNSNVTTVKPQKHPYRCSV